MNYNSSLNLSETRSKGSRDISKDQFFMKNEEFHKFPVENRNRIHADVNEESLQNPPKHIKKGRDTTPIDKQEEAKNPILTNTGKDEIYELYNSAEDLMSHNRYEEAGTVLKQLCGHKELSALHPFYIGLIYGKIAKRHQALKNYEQALDDYQHMMECLKGVEESGFLDVIRCKAGGQADMAGIHYSFQRYKEAKRCYEESSRLLKGRSGFEDDRAHYLWAIGMISIHEEDFTEAIRKLEEIVQMGHKPSLDRYNKILHYVQRIQEGKMLEDAKDHEQAAKFYKDLLKNKDISSIPPSISNQIFERATNTLIILKNDEEALKVQDQYIELNKQNKEEHHSSLYDFNIAQALLRKANIHYSLARLFKALSLYEQCILLFNDFPQGDFPKCEARIKISSIQYQLRKCKEAKSSLEECFRLIRRCNKGFTTLEHVSQKFPLIFEELDLKKEYQELLQDLKTNNSKQTVKPCRKLCILSDALSSFFKDVHNLENYLSKDSTFSYRNKRHLKTMKDDIAKGTYGYVGIILDGFSNNFYIEKKLKKYEFEKAKKEYKALLKVKKANDPDLLLIKNLYHNKKRKEFSVLMEYAPQNLSTITKYIVEQQIKYTDDDIICIYLQLLYQATKLRDLNIFHSDIKPDNAIVTDEGRIKLIDFGVSKVLKAHGEQELSIEGTFNYMAPKLAEALKKKQITYKYDPYEADKSSIGIVVDKIMKQDGRTDTIDDLIIKYPKYEQLRNRLFSPKKVHLKYDDIEIKTFKVAQDKLRLKLDQFLKEYPLVVENWQYEVILRFYKKEEVVEWIRSKLSGPKMDEQFKLLCLIPGMIYKQSNQKQKAINYFQKIEQEGLCSGFTLDVCHIIAQLAFELQAPKTAELYCKKRDELVQLRGAIPRKEHVYYYLELGITAFLNKKYDDALEYTNKAQEIDERFRSSLEDDEILLRIQMLNTKIKMCTGNFKEE